MVQSYKFAIVRLAPEGVRDERINIGAVVFGHDDVDVRLPRRLDKARVISAALDHDAIRELAETISARDFEIRQAGISDPEARLRAIGRIGPLTLSRLGAFACSSEREYEARLSSIFQSIVEPEPAPKLPRLKRSRLLTQLKRALREERVLAAKDEDLTSHRVVAGVPLAEGLVADLVLKNGAMHVFETVDVSSDDTTARKVVTDIAVSALILEQARISFGDSETTTRLVYEASTSMESAARSCLEAAAHQGAELINWASTSDRIKLVTTIASLAVPVARKQDRAKRTERSDSPKLRLA